MYQLVKTNHQQKQFAATWEFFCNKFGWINDPYAENGIRYNLLYKQGMYRRRKVIGTIEFIPYNPQSATSTVEGKFTFSKFREINLFPSRVWEIDKLCIHQDYQRQGHFQIFAKIIMEHATRFNCKYYLALIEKKFYRMLHILFGACFEQKGEELIGPGTSLIPTCIDVEALMKYAHKFSI